MKGVAEKLGLKSTHLGRVVGRPQDVQCIPEFENLAPMEKDGIDNILIFLKGVADVEAALKTALQYYAAGKHLWFAYPKQSGKIKTDLTRDRGWDQMAKADLLPVTQIAIDDNWSALRFRFRSEIKILTRKSDLPGMKC